MSDPTGGGDRKGRRRAGFRQLNATQRQDSIARAKEDSVNLAESQSTLGGKIATYLRSKTVKVTSFPDSTNQANIDKQIARGKGKK